MKKFRILSCLFLLAVCNVPVHAASHDAIIQLANGVQAAVYYPPAYAADSKGKTWPGLLFSHGFAGSALSQDELLHRLAGLGILVIAIEHSDPVAFERIPPRKGDRRWSILKYMRNHPFDEKTYDYRPREFAQFASEVLQRFPVDPQKLVFAGHSMGGYTIFNAYNQVSVKPVAMIVYSTGELNFKRGHPYFSAAQLAAIKVPLLLTYGEDEFDANKGPYAKEIQHLYGGPTEIMMIKGGGHLSYNDPAHWWGKKKRLQQIEVVFNRSREFLQKILQ